MLQILLQRYTPHDANEAAMTALLTRFISTAQGDVFGREIVAGDSAGEENAVDEALRGHLTGSAWVVNGDGSRVVLVHHAKLGRWVQPGGHCDGEADALSVAVREAREETGLEVEPLDPDIFDIDVHPIPEYWQTPQHFHFDVRFLLRADDKSAPIVSPESHAVRWVSLEEAVRLNSESSVARMVDKTRKRFAPSTE